MRFPAMAVLELLYRVKQREFAEKLREMTSEDVVYVTDLASCSHKRVMRRHYPLLGFRFEPSLLLGDLVHRGLASILSENGGGRWRAEVPVEARVEVDGRVYTLKGRVDLVLYNEQGEPEAVVEVKTGRDLPDNAPREHHLLQLKVYMKLLGVDRGYLLYVTPERVVEHPVEAGDVDVEGLVREAVRDSARPRYQWECRYCPYRRLCPYALPQRSQ